MNTKDFLLGLIVGLPVGFALVLFKCAQARLGWSVSGTFEVPVAATALFIAIIVSNVIRKSKAGAWLHVTASDVPVENLFVEFAGVLVAAAAISALVLNFT